MVGTVAPTLRRRRWLRGGIGLAALVSVGLTVWLGLWVTPPAVGMGNLARLLYVHPPVAWVAYLSFSVTALASAAYLWPRTRARGWDLLAGASAEVGLVFTGLTIVTGSIWGRPFWHVWWTWDPRITTTALLGLLYLGYVALRRVPGEEERVGRRNAIAAIVAFVDVPINYLSVYWWTSIHQTGTVLNPEKTLKVEGIMAWTLLLGFVAFTLVYAWMTFTRYESMEIAEAAAEAELTGALAERVAEGAPVVAPRVADSVGVGTARVSTVPAGSDPDQEEEVDPRGRPVAPVGGPTATEIPLVHRSAAVGPLFGGHFGPGAEEGRTPGLGVLRPEVEQ
jgi:heme exporter protein C